MTTVGRKILLSHLIVVSQLLLLKLMNGGPCRNLTK